jgi:thiopeptide-type bacteriocin biosynthesis protein
LSLRAASFFLLRTPRLPVSQFRRWSDDLQCSSRDLALCEERSFPERLSTDRAALRQSLRAIVEDATVAEAIYVASPSLSQRLGKWLADPESKEGAKAEQVLVRYFARMAARATPFGLFAGFSVGSMGEATRLEITGPDHRHARLDMDYVARLVETLEGDEVLRQGLRYWPNNALYEALGAIRYPELRVTETSRYFELSEVPPTAHLQAALARASSGATRQEIADAAAQGEVDEEDAVAFVDELIDLRILESNLMPPITGGEPLSSLVATLRASSPRHVSNDQGSLPDLGRALPVLEEVQRSLADLNDNRAAVDSTPYEAIAAALEQLPVAVDRARLFQVDMSRGASATLGHREIESIARGAVALHTLSPGTEDLSAFVRAFVTRYGQREVPLMVAMDEEIGVGHAVRGATALEPVPLVKGLRARKDKANSTQQTWSTRDKGLLELLADAWATGTQALTLTDERVAELGEEKPPPMPASIAVLATILSPSPGAPEAQHRIWLNSWLGGSAARYFGRFAAWNHDLTEALRRHLQDEEQAYPGTILAEIVHMPDTSRIGNLLLRPVLRRHEIPFCGRSGAAEDQLIALSDLYVSVRGGRVVLRSRKLGAEILTRLSTAHNYTAPKQLAVYRFLASLQAQGETVAAAWNWGALADAKFLPRVEYGSIILAPAQWRLSQAELAALLAPTAVERYRAAAQLRARHRLPRFLGLQDNDNVLPVDLDNSLSIDAVAPLLKDRPIGNFIELFLGEADQVCRGPRGAHTNEVVVPFLVARTTDRDRASSQAGRRRTPDDAVTFYPGGEWLHAKIRCEPAVMDRVLSNGVRPVVDHATRAGQVDRWHFTRHLGATPHVRLFLHGPAETLSAGALPLIERSLRPLLASGMAQSYELAAYEPDIDLYGGRRGAELAELIFFEDSKVALTLVERLCGRPEGRERWSWALLGTARLFADVGLDLSARRLFALEGLRGARKELGLTVEDDREIAERFRSERAVVERLLQAPNGEGIDQLFDDRKRALQGPLAELAALHSASELGVSLEGYLQAIVRAWNHRVLRAKVLLHEVVLYTFLAKHYESVAARGGG